MPGFILSILILLMMVSSGCNNPSGGSVVSRGHTPLLKPPGAFSFSQVRAKDGDVSLRWRASARVSSYQVFQGTSSGTITTPVTSCSGLITTCSITGLDPLTTHYFSVTATNAAGTMTINSAAPALSVGSFDITSSTFNDGQISLEWDNSVGATSYSILYGTTPESYSNTIANVTSPYTINGLVNGRNYYFRVLATNALNGYGLSTSQGTERPIGPPPAPQGVALTTSPGQIKVDWNTVPETLHYKIYKGTASGSLSLLTTVPTNTFTDTNVNDGTTYYYAIVANNSFDGARSAEVSARTIENFNLSSVNIGAVANQLVISFPAVVGASDYSIRYGTNPANLSSTANSVTSPYTLSGLAGGSTYYFRVVATNNIGAGASVTSTNTLSGIPIPSINPPTGVAASATPASVTVSWNPVTGASSYEVLKGTTSGNWTALQTGVIGTSATDSPVANGTTYFYVVRSYNGLFSTTSSEVSVKPIENFNITSITPATSSSLQISWGAVTGADAYDIRYGTVSGSYTGTVTGVTSPYTLTGLTANTTYYVVVRARNSVGTGTNVLSSQSSGKTKTAAPSGLVATTSPTQISLDWANTGGADEYTVYRGTASNSLSVLASNVLTSDYIDSSASPGTTYFYAVTADNGTESARSSEVQARSIEDFTISSTSAPNPNSIIVTWPVVTGAATYDVRYGTSSGSYSTTLTNRTSPFTITGLNSGSTYYIRVVARNAVGTGSAESSPEVSQSTPVGPPGGMTAAVANGQITISWTAVGGASSYKIYRSATSGGPYSEIAAGNVPTSYVDTDVDDGDINYYVVTSFNGADSAYSSEVSGKTIADFAINSLTAPSPVTVTVDFPSTVGGDLYDVRYGTATGNYTTTVSGATSPYTFTALANTTYYVVVRARNSVGSGASRSTAELSVKTPVAAPSSLAATSTPGNVSLTWGAVSGATSYKVYRGLSSGTYSQIAAPATNSFNDNSVVNGTPYFYIVRAFNGSDSAASDEVTIRPIASHTISSVTSPTSTILEVTWGGVTGATGYDVRWGTASGSYSYQTLDASSPYTITALTPNTTYYVVVRAKNSVGAGTNVLSTEVIQKTAPVAPSGLTASATPGNVGLNWTATAGASGYKIYRKTSSGSYSEIGTSGTNAFGDNSAVNGTTYFYVVRANNGSDSAYSNEVSIMPISSFSLTAAAATSPSEINLTWDVADGAATYDVRYGTSSGVYLGTVTGVTSPYTLSGLSANTQYFISIRANNTVGSGTLVNSNELNATTAPAAPAGLVATAVTSQVNLSWNAVTGATNYRIYRGNSSGSYSQIASGVTGTTYPDTSAANGSTYYYVVRSYNGTESDDSNESSARPIAAFTVGSTTAPSTSTIEVSWTNPTGSTLYDVRYGTSSGTYTTVTGVTSPYIITGLASGTNYYVVVRARNAIGGGASVQTPEVQQVTPIGPPTGLAASAAPSAITLSWTAAGGATSYKIMRGTSSGSLSEIASGVTGTSYPDNSAVNGTQYYYAVRSYNGADSLNSSEVTSKSIATFSTSGISSPSHSSISVSWNDTDGSDSYDVRYGTSTGSYSTTVTGATSPYTITGLNANQTYYVVVRANNSVGAGATLNTPEVSQKTAPLTPTGLTATASPGQVGLNWTAVAGAGTYNVYRGTVSGTLSYLGSSGTNAYLDTTAANGTTYFYAVRANNGTDSDDSSEVSVRPIGSFTLASAVAASSSSINLTFGSGVGADSYTVRYGTSSGVYLGSISGISSPYTLTGLSPATQYFISIRANNTVGAGTNFDTNELNTVTSTAAPTTLASTVATGQIDLSWAAADGAASYRVYRKVNSGSYSQIASGVTSTTFSDTTIADGTQYYYVVRAFNGTESENSNEVTGQSIASFLIASTSAPTTSTIEVNWPSPDGGATYDVLYGTSSGSYSTVSNVTSPHTLTGLSGGTTYYIKVRAKNTVGPGTSADSDEVTQITPIAAPTGLASVAAPGQISLSWNASTGASSYKIYRGTSSGSYSEIADNHTLTTYTDGSLTNGNTYYYVVRAYNGADSAPSNETSKTIIADFSSAIATTLDASTIQLSWPLVTGATSYNIKYGTTSGGPYTTTLNNQTSPTTISSLDNGSTYYFIVEAVNGTGGGTVEASPEIGATTSFGAPSGLAATGTTASVNLTWTAVAGASSYKILRRETATSFTEIASTGTNAHSDSSASNGVQYFYVVRAYNGTDSANSNEVTVKTISAFNFSAMTPASSTSLNLTWTSATGADSYDVRYGTSTGSYSQTVSGVSSSYTLTGLNAGTRYYVLIRARNAVGAGTNKDSSELNAITSPGAPTLTAAVATTGQVALAWTAGPGTTTNYNVYRSTTSGSGYAAVVTAHSGTTYTDTSGVNGTQYYYVVRANNGTESENSNERTAQTIAPFTISATAALSTSSIQVTWPATNGAAEYDVRYGTSTGSYSTTLSNVTSPYTITGLNGGTNYYIVVRARNNTGSGSSAQTAEVQQITPLNAPSGLAAVSTPGKVTLSWNNVTGAQSYKVFRKITSGSYSEIEDGVTSLSFEDTTASNGTQYFYVVKAYNGADSADSNEVTTLPMANFAITSTTSPASDSIEVTFPVVSGAETYDVRYGTATGNYSTTLTGVTSPYTITGLTANQNYYIVVRANNTIGADTSVTSSESIQKSAPAAPTALTASATPATVNLNWTAPAGATTYTIYRGTDSGTLSAIETGYNTTSYADTVTDGTTYFYAVSGNNGSDSARSSVVSVQSISTFTLSTATPASTSSIDLEWADATGETSYDIQVGTSSGTYGAPINTTGTTYTVTGLNPGSTYYFRIQAKNSVGSGTTVNSNELNAKTLPGAPNLLSAVATTGQVVLTWSAGTGTTTNYQVYRSLTSGSGYSAVGAPVAGTTFTDSTINNGTQYYYIIRGSNGAESPDSNERTAQSVAPFVITSTEALSPTEIRVTFPSPAGASEYDIVYGTSAGSLTSTASNVTSPVIISGLAGNTTYYFAVRGKNTTGSGSFTQSNTVSRITPLAAPGGIAALASVGKIRISWTTNGADSYKVLRGDTPGNYNQTFSGISNTPYDDTSVVNGQQYYYAVVANNGSDSAPSTEVTGKTIANFAISLSSVTHNSMVVSWTNPDGGSTYDVSWGTSPGLYTTGTSTGVSSGVSITGLNPNTFYYVTVTAKNTIGSGTYTVSAESNQKTAYGAPVGLVADANNVTGKVGLNWTSSGASLYKVYRGVSSGSLSLHDTTGTNAYLDTLSVTNGQLYFYAVRAVNSEGVDSALSTETSVKPIETITLTAATPASASSLTFTWDSPNDGAEAYDIHYGTNSTGPYLFSVSNVTSPYTLSGLDSGTTYYAVIRGRNDDGVTTTFQSNEMNAKTGLGAPTGVAVAGTPGTATVSWNTVSGATNYRLYRATSASGPYSHVTTTTSLSHPDSGRTNGTPYYYIVRSYNGIESEDSTEVSVKTIRSFAITAATTTSSTSADIAWETHAGEGADGYDLRVGTNAGNMTTVQTGITSTYSLTTGLSPATTYLVSVRGRNNQGAGTNFDTANATFTTATSAPVLTAAVAATGQVSLQWNAAAGATNYNIYRSTTSTGPYTLIYSGETGTTRVDTNAIVNGTTYYYVVRSFNGTESANSNELVATPIGTFAVSSTQALSSSSIRVTWGAAAGATEYDVQYGTSSGSYTTLTNKTSPFDITGLNGNTLYYIRVQAKNSSGSGTTANTAEVTQITPVAAPSNLAAVGGSGQINLSWNTVSGATSYKVLRGTSSGSFSELATGITSLTYSDTTAANGTTYYYVVRAFNGADSASSNEVFKQAIATPSISSIEGNTSSSIRVSWSAVTGAESYEVRYGTSSGSYGPATAATSPFTISGLTYSSTYYVQVIAKNTIGGGSTVYSAESSGSPNDPAILSDVGDQTTESERPVTVNFTLTDADHLPSCTTFMSGSTSSNTTLVPNANIVFSGSVPNCNATITPATGETGTTTISLIANDGISTTTDTFTLTVTQCSVASITWDAHPGNINAGSNFSTAPKVSLRRADNSLCTTNTNPVSLSVSTDTSPQQDAALTGTVSVVPTGGSATFTGTGMTRAGTSMTLKATHGSVVSPNSNAFNVTALAPTKIAFYQQPQSTKNLVIMVPYPVVRTTDTYGNYVNVNGLNVTLSLINNTEGATLSGTVTRPTNASGIATFDNLFINYQASYNMRATPAAGPYTAIDSSAFNIVEIIPQDTVAIWDMIQGPASINVAPAFLSLPTNAFPTTSQIFGTTHVDGGTTYKWKIVAGCASTWSFFGTQAQPSELRLMNGGTQVATIAVPANSATPTLYTANISNANISPESTWTINVYGNVCTLYSSKIVAQQTDANKTQVYIPLSSINHSSANNYIQTTSSTHNVISEINHATYNFDFSKIGYIDTARLMFTYSSPGGAQACARLYTTGGTAIGDEVCGTGTAITTVLGSINPSDLPSTGELQVRVRSGTNGTAIRFHKAGLILRLVNIENVQMPQIVTGAFTGMNATANYPEFRSTGYSNSFGGATVDEYVRCQARASSNGNASFIYKDHGTSVSGTSGSTISASTNQFTNQNTFTILEAGPIATSPGNNTYMNFTRTSGTFEVSNCLHITQGAY